MVHATGMSMLAAQPREILIHIQRTNSGFDLDYIAASDESKRYLIVKMYTQEAKRSKAIFQSDFPLPPHYIKLAIPA